MKHVIITMIAVAGLFISAPAQDKLCEIISNELNRNMEALKKEKVAPYFMSYRVNEITTYTISAVFGQITESSENKSRKLSVDVHCGDPTLDNTHPIKGNDFNFFRYSGPTIPLENNKQAIQQALWRETEARYRVAAEDYSTILAEKSVKVEDEDKSEDFSKEESVKYYEKPLSEKETDFDIRLWEEKLKKYSACFLSNTDLLNGTATLYFKIERKYFVSSEGSEITENRISTYLYISAETQADDGMKLPLHKSYFAFNPEDLPEDNIIISDAQKISSLLTQLRNAPVVDSYTGPALLAAASAGVFFHEIFGHRIEDQRMKDENDAQTFKKKVGEKVLNENLSIIFDPTIEKFHEFYLNGAYKYDDQGQKSQRVVIIENGILKNFLMSRTPITGFPNSNGHGRAQQGMLPVSRQSNMFVQSSDPKTNEELRQMLIEEAKRQGKEYGYYFVETVGGFTTTGRYMPNAFNVTPTLVYRIYVDGRPDELVRGVDLIGTPLSIFSQVEAAGNDYGIFTGTCGAESGGVPVSTVCPTLFVKQIETQRKSKNQDKLPVLSRP